MPRPRRAEPEANAQDLAETGRAPAEAYEESFEFLRSSATMRLPQEGSDHHDANSRGWGAIASREYGPGNRRLTHGFWRIALVFAGEIDRSLTQKFEFGDTVSSK